ncbi:ABC transporter permease [Williamsoniiplasma somnilux]|uniref:ABC transporter permease n=1 Tax=Williamsoniiplasma somnilux TaxID=215578 RepID=A0A2K8P0X3_9MOLU|nr:ABC transporter permease [Williamsoniiplasma somnilux]ATZ19088.1 ABC transporter permease [Williamsoniiplasma somnilux]
MKSNQLLMLKQGVKGVFKFRIQFSIILLLTFIASLILTVSISTNRRLQHEYNDIVKSTQKFDNTWALNTGKNVMASEERSFIPILDTISSVNSYVGANDKSDYNVVLNQNPINGSVNNYITRTTNSPEFISAFDNMFKTFLDYPSHLDTQSYNSALYQEKILLTEILATQFFRDLKILQDTPKNTQPNKDIEYLLDTPFGNYTLRNNGWFTKYSIFKDLSEQKLSYSAILEDMKNNHSSEEEAQLLMYAFFAIQSLSERIGYVMSDGWFNNQNWTKDDIEKVYKYVFGIDYKDPLNLEKTQGYYLNIPTNISIQNINKDKDNYVLFGSDEIKNLKDQLKISGWRGNTNLVITNANYDKNGNVYEISWNNSNLFSGLYNELKTFASTSFKFSNDFGQNMEKYFSIFQSRSEWMDSVNPNGGFFDANIQDKNGLKYSQKRASAFLTHERLVAKAVGYDSYVRREILYNDASTQKKYRAIALQDDQLTKFKILKGVMPSSNGEIAISSQFAKKNNVKIGDYLKIGNALFYITAFAVDTYSFYPSADPLIPLPKGETDGLIYASPETLQLLTQNSNEESSIYGDITQTFNFINISKINPSDQSSLNVQRNKYIIFSNASKNNAQRNALLLKDPVELQKDVQAKGFFNLQDFNQSTYHFSWTLYPLVFKVYSSITYFAAALIGIIELASLIVCVRKTIQANSKQIGILKALGVESKQISLSYISYSFFIGFIAVPLGWLVGTALQIPMVNIFLNYFSFTQNEIFFDWMAPLIAFVCFGLFSALVGFLTAYWQTNKPVLAITLSKTRWAKSATIEFVKRTVFKKSNFQTRLTLQLASSGKQVIMLLVICVFISSLLISAGLALPAVAINAKQTYFNNTNFRNSVTYKSPIGNSPFSKDGVAFWQGQNILDKDYVDNDPIPLDISGKVGYYNNPNNYTSSVNNASIFPSLQYTKMENNQSEINTIFENVAKSRTGITNAFLSAAGNALALAQGVGFSIGAIEQFYAYALNVDKLIDQNGEVILDSSSTDADRISAAARFSSGITTALPQVLETLISNWENNVGVDGTWKDQLIGMLVSYAPSFIKSYLNSQSRNEQFALGFATSTYVPKEETFATVINAKSDNHNNIKITGLDASQNAIKMSDSLKSKVFLNSQEGRNVKVQVEQILNNNYTKNEDIIFNGLKIWDNTTKTLTLPSANNEQANAYYSMKEGDYQKNVEAFGAQAFELFSPVQGGNIKLPNNAWAYNDTDYIESAKDWSGLSEDMHQGDRTLLNQYGYEKTNNGNFYLDPQTIQTSKITYNLQYQIADNSPAPITGTDYAEDSSGKFNSDKWSGINNKAYMFGDFKYDKDGVIVSSFIRPYYQYKNVELFIPISFALSQEEAAKTKLGPVDDTRIDGSINNKTKNYKEPIAKYLTDTLGNKSENVQWYLSQTSRVVANENVPKFVKDSWGSQKNEYRTEDKYIVVNAYDSRFSSYRNSVGPAISDGTQNGGELNALTEGYWTWILNAVNGQTLKVNSASPISRGLAKTINLKNVGTIKTYDSSLIVLDSDLANMLNGWSTARTSSYDYNGFDVNTKRKDPDSRFYKYDLVDFTKLKSTKNWQKTAFVKSADSQDYNPHAFYNVVLSNFDEPLAVTSSASMINLSGKQGVTDIAGHGFNGGVEGYGIEDFNFLSEKISLLNQITSVAIWIAILIVTAVVVAAALLIMLLGDIYIAQYKRFIIMLRSFGYSNRSIMTYVLGTVTILSLTAWIIATTLTWGGIALIISFITKSGFAIPFGVLWWAPVGCIVIMLIAYLGSLLVSSKSARKEDVATMMSATSE